MNHTGISPVIKNNPKGKGSRQQRRQEHQSALITPLLEFSEPPNQTAEILITPNDSEYHVSQKSTHTPPPSKKTAAAAAARRRPLSGRLNTTTHRMNESSRVGNNAQPNNSSGSSSGTNSRPRILYRDGNQSRDRWSVERFATHDACNTRNIYHQNQGRRNNSNQNSGCRCRCRWNKIWCSDWFHSLGYKNTVLLMIILFLTYTGIVVFFAMCYSTVSRFGAKFKEDADGSIIKQSFCDMDINNRMEALYFSLSTMTTIGYGVSDYYFGDCWTPLILVLAQVCSALTFDAIAIGLLFQRISRGRKRAKSILFSNDAVIRCVQGVPYLMLRIAELRKQQLMDVKVKLYCIRHERCPVEQTRLVQQRNHQLMATELSPAQCSIIDTTGRSSANINISSSMDKKRIGIRNDTTPNPKENKARKRSNSSTYPGISTVQQRTSAREEAAARERAGVRGRSLFSREKPKSNRIGCDGGGTGSSSGDSSLDTWSNAPQPVRDIRNVKLSPLISIPTTPAIIATPGVPIETTHFQTRQMKLFHPAGADIGNDILMSLPQVIVHKIDECSPLMPLNPMWYDASGISYQQQPVASMSTNQNQQFLQQQTPQSKMLKENEMKHFFNDREIEIIVVIEGIDELTGSTVQARHSYKHDEDILWNHTFEACVFPNRRNDDSSFCCSMEGGKSSTACVVDFSLFHNTRTVPLDCMSCPYIPSSFC